MNPTRTQQLPNSSFKGAVIVSLLIHGLLIALSFFTGDLFTSFEKDIPINLIEQSVRVDVVAMPKMTVKELESLPKMPTRTAPEEVSVKPVKKEEFVEKVADDSKAPVIEKTVKKKSFMEMLKEQKRKKLEAAKAPKNRPVEEDVDSETRSQLNNLILEGNRVQKGTARTGDGEVVQGAFAEYVSSLPEYIREYWKLPSWLKEKRIKMCCKSLDQFSRRSRSS